MSLSRIPHPRLPLVKLYRKSFFMKETCPLCKKINPKKKYEKTDLGFGFPTPDYLWCNFI